MLALDTCMLWEEKATRANLSLLLQDPVTRAVFLSRTLLLRLLSLLFPLVLQAWTWNVLSWNLPLRQCLHLGQNRLQEGRDVNAFTDFVGHTLSGSTNASGLLHLSVTELHIHGRRLQGGYDFLDGSSLLPWVLTLSLPERNDSLSFCWQANGFVSLNISGLRAFSMRKQVTNVSGCVFERLFCQNTVQERGCWREFWVLVRKPQENEIRV